jgi:hypothetical protein
MKKLTIKQVIKKLQQMPQNVKISNYGDVTFHGTRKELDKVESIISGCEVVSASELMGENDFILMCIGDK